MGIGHFSLFRRKTDLDQFCADGSIVEFVGSFDGKGLGWDVGLDEIHTRHGLERGFDGVKTVLAGDIWDRIAKGFHFYLVMLIKTNNIVVLFA